LGHLDGHVRETVVEFDDSHNPIPPDFHDTYRQLGKLTIGAGNPAHWSSELREQVAQLREGMIKSGYAKDAPVLGFVPDQEQSTSSS
jgi:hypothetical protein